MNIDELESALDAEKYNNAVYSATMNSAKMAFNDASKKYSAARKKWENSAKRIHEIQDLIAAKKKESK